MIFNEHIAKVAENYLKKGTKVYLEGQLQTRKWQDQSGREKYTTEIVLQRFRGELNILSDGRSSDDGRWRLNAARRIGQRHRPRQQPARFRQHLDRMDRRPRSRSKYGDIDDDIPF